VWVSKWRREDSGEPGGSLLDKETGSYDLSASEMSGEILVLLSAEIKTGHKSFIIVL
jgi:hypothetical protein